MFFLRGELPLTSTMQKDSFVVALLTILEQKDEVLLITKSFAMISVFSPRDN